MLLLAFIALLADPNWISRLGKDPVFAANLQRSLKSLLNTRLPDPSQYPAKEFATTADAGSACVNLYRLSGDPQYKEQARRIVDWLVRSNEYLVAHKDPAIPLLGWGPETRDGYFKCPTVGNYHADDLWTTATVLRCLLKYSEIDPQSPCLRQAKKIIDGWPYKDHSFNDGPYAAAGMRWYMKSNQPCEIRYVKNTNVAMGEQLFRMFKLTGDARYFSAGMKVLYSQIWDILTRRNLTYDSYMIHLDKSDPVYAAMTAHAEHKIVHRDGVMLCGPKDASCWDHLGYEGYGMYVIQQLIKDVDPKMFPVPDTPRALAATIQSIMSAFHNSVFGNTATFDWNSGATTTHIITYNCALRFSSDPNYESECVTALRKHKNWSNTSFYSLVPDAMFTEAQATRR